MCHLFLDLLSEFASISADLKTSPTDLSWGLGNFWKGRTGFLNNWHPPPTQVKLFPQRLRWKCARFLAYFCKNSSIFVFFSLLRSFFFCLGSQSRSSFGGSLLPLRVRLLGATTTTKRRGFSLMSLRYFHQLPSFCDFCNVSTYFSLCLHGCWRDKWKHLFSTNVPFTKMCFLGGPCSSPTQIIIFWVLLISKVP